MKSNQLPIQQAFDALYALNQIESLNPSPGPDQITQEYLWTKNHPIDIVLAYELSKKDWFPKSVLKDLLMDRVYNHLFFVEESQQTFVEGLRARLNSSSKSSTNTQQDPLLSKLQDDEKKLLATRQQMLAHLEQALELALEIYYSNKKNNTSLAKKAYYDVLFIKLALADLYQKIAPEKLLKNATAIADFVAKEKGMDHQDTFNAYYKLGATHEFLGNMQKAKELYRLVAKLEKNRQKPNSYPTPIRALKKSINYHHLAIIAYEEEPNSLEKAAAYADCGSAYFERGDYASAFDALKMAHDMYGLLGDVFGIKDCEQKMELAAAYGNLRHQVAS